MLRPPPERARVSPAGVKAASPLVWAGLAGLAVLLMVAPGCEPDSVDADGVGGASAGEDHGDASTTIVVPGDPAASRDAGVADAVVDRGETTAADAAPAADAGATDAPAAQTGVCDLSGRWLVAQRLLVTAAGQQQSAHTWYYYELQQQGAALTVIRGLHCGYQVVKKTALGASVDSSAAWPSFLARNSSAGRRGQVTEESGGCHVTLAREYVVRGATIPYYANPAVALPDRNQPAAAGNPGWEDWDGDGNPGISIRVTSALASGTLYDCQREWTEYDALVMPADVLKFKARVTANNEHVVLGRSGGSPQTLESSSSLSSDSSQHYAWLHRLQPSQVPGTDQEICAAVRTLADSLVPEAAQ